MFTFTFRINFHIRFASVYTLVVGGRECFVCNTLIYQVAITVCAVAVGVVVVFHLCCQTCPLYSVHKVVNMPQPQDLYCAKNGTKLRLSNRQKSKMLWLMHANKSQVKQNASCIYRCNCFVSFCFFSVQIIVQSQRTFQWYCIFGLDVHFRVQYNFIYIMLMLCDARRGP